MWRLQEGARSETLRAVGCETIYAFIYRTAHKAEALWRYPTRRHKRRRPRRARASRDTIKDRASIHQRPKTIESRGEAGHWEGDLIREAFKMPLHSSSLRDR
jgi:IS30 family transposase